MKVKKLKKKIKIKTRIHEIREKLRMCIKTSFYRLYFCCECVGNLKVIKFENQDIRVIFILLSNYNKIYCKNATKMHVKI